MKKLFFMTVLCILGLGAAPYVAANEVNPQLAQCQELQSEATRSLMKSCAAHIGCEFALKRKNSCSDAAKFIGKLKTSMVGAKKITNEIIFEAALPALTSSDAMEKKIAAVRQAWRSKKVGQQQGVRNFVDETGKLKPYYYEGGLKNGKPHGIGIKISPSGYFRQGEFVDDAFSGQGWAYRDFDVVMFVGDFVNGHPYGNVAFQSKEGNVLVGHYRDSKFHGVVDTVIKNGSHFKMVHDDDGKNIGNYSASVSDEVALRLAISQQKEKAAAEERAAQANARAADQEQARQDEENARSKQNPYQLLGNLAAAALTGKDSGERIKMMNEVLSQSSSKLTATVHEKQDAQQLLGGLVTAAITGKNSSERIKMMNEVLSQSSNKMADGVRGKQDDHQMLGDLAVAALTGKNSSERIKKMDEALSKYSSKVRTASSGSASNMSSGSNSGSRSGVNGPARPASAKDSSKPSSGERCTGEGPEYVACTSCKGHPMGEEECREGVYNMFGKKPPSSSSANRDKSGNSGKCSLEDWGRENAEFDKRCPLKSSWGMNATMQYAYFKVSESLNSLDKYKSCLPDAQYNETRTALLKSRDDALKGCKQTAVSASTCQPRCPN